MEKLPNISPRLGIFGGVALLAVILLIGGCGKYNSVRNSVIDKEAALTAQYVDNQNFLSSYVSGFYEQTGLAKIKSQKINDILIGAVKGRYDDGSSAKPVGGQAFSAIAEAYPDLKSLDIYDKITDYVQSQREAYRQTQSKLLDMIRSYEAFTKKGLVQSQFVKFVGAPTNDLRAQVGTKITRGQDALDQMYMIVLDKKTKQAYETGEMEPLSVPEG
jgi:hypothetical protein